MVLFDAREDEQVEVTLNGASLPPLTRDVEWKDPQIFSPRPQPASGGNGNYQVNPRQRLLRLDFAVDPQRCVVGENSLGIRVRDSAEGADGGVVQLEKVEVQVQYGEAK